MSTRADEECMGNGGTMGGRKVFDHPVRGLLIRNGWYEIVETDDPASLLGAEETETPALKVGEEIYGCVCDRNARESGLYKKDTVVLRRKRFLGKDRFYGYVMGPVFIYLNRGLDDLDIEFLRRRILLHEEEPFLLVEDFVNMVYDDTDP